MPVPPSITKTIRSIRTSMTSGTGEIDTRQVLYLLIDQLFRDRARIVGDADTLDTVLALAADIDSYRGKGSQVASKEFHQRLIGLIFRAKLDFPGPENRDEGSHWWHKLSAYFFLRVQGPPARSQHAGRLKSLAWFALGELSMIQSQHEHLAHAMKVAADPRGADEEREGAIQFLATYWDGGDPDEATARLLDDLEKDPANRELLVSILQAQSDLGLKDGFDMMFAMDDWDDGEAK